MKAFINATIFDYETYKEDCYIIFDRNIVKIGSMPEFKGAEVVYDAKGCIVMPGFVLGHTHVYSTFARGMSVPFNPKSFRDILEQLWWKLDSSLDLESVYYSGLVSGIEFIKNGVTTIIDHHASGEVKGSVSKLKDSLCDEIGLRGIFCFETSDRFNIDLCIGENINFAQTANEKCSGLFGMHASMTLSDKTLDKVKNRIGKLPIHIHVAESMEDQEDSYKKYNRSIVERLEQFGLINKNSILAHCVHINEKDAEIIAKRGAYVAVNPTSNMNNAVGLPNYSIFKENNINVILGNDGLGFNFAKEIQNLAFSMKHRLQSPIAFSLDDVLNVIKNNYRYAREALGIKLGRIMEGFKADMMVIPYTSPTLMNEENAMSHVLFGAFDNLNPRDVLCDGEFLMRDFEVNIDVEKIYSEARKISKNVWEKLGV